MKKLLLIITLWSFGYHVTSQTIAEQNKVVASDRFTDDEFGYSAAIYGDHAIVGAHHEDEDINGTNTISNCGSAYIYEKNGSGNWVGVQKIVASDRGGYDRYGFSVTTHGEYIAVGAHNIEAGQGAVYLYKKNGSGTWVEHQKLVAPTRRSGSGFGYSISMNGNYLIVGARGESYDENETNSINFSGAAYIFELNGTTWSFAQKIVASDRAIENYFGHSAAITEEGYAAIGAYWNDTDENGLNPISRAGAAYIFERNSSGNWTEVQKVTAIDRTANLWWGRSIAIDSNVVAVGAQEDMQGVNGSQSHGAGGSVTIFERNTSGSWNFSQKIISNDRRSGDRFGTSISIDSSNLLIGAPTSSTDINSGNYILGTGAVYLFNKINNVWTQTQKEIASDRGTSDDRFGFSVCISGQNAIISAYKQDTDVNGNNTYSNAGAAYIFSACNSASTINETSCDSYTSPSNLYTWTMSGTYYDTIQNSGGCDSVLTINLTIINSTSSTDIQSACGSYTWIDGNTYTANNNSATYTTTNTAGCDSIITLDLTILNSTTSTDTQSACGSYTWIDGNTYTTNNNSATYTTTNAAGCDSTITLDLTIHNVDTSVTQNNLTLTANTSGAQYQWIECDNFSSLIGETNISFTPTTNGSYAVEITTPEGCVDTSSCYTVLNTSIQELNKSIKIFPHPFETDFNLSFYTTEERTITLYDINGTIVFSETTAEQEINLRPAQINRGTYILNIIDKNSTSNYTIVKH